MEIGPLIGVLKGWGKNLKLRACGKTDKGRVRDQNQDVFCIEESLGLLAVADGMGGHASGEVASKMGMDILKDYLKGRKESLPGVGNPSYLESTNRMAAGVKLANQAIYEASLSHSTWNGMGTTLTAVLLNGNRLSIAHVGDSRVYLIRGGIIEQMTDDHTVVSEQVERGLMTREEAADSAMRHILTRALGITPDVEVDMEELTVSEEDKLVLCSDGLTELISDDEILSTVLSGNRPEVACDQLVELANQKGGEDNITVIVAFLDREGFLSRFLKRLGLIRR
jgi:serine/threonine protein phosphatase PrpC